VTAGVALAAAAAVMAWGSVHTIREIFFHGFAPACSDGNPEYDARYCELPGGPSSLHVAAAMLVVVISLVALWAARRRSGHDSLAGESVDADRP
jgi:hypothetical protein